MTKKLTLLRERIHGDEERIFDVELVFLDSLRVHPADAERDSHRACARQHQSENGEPQLERERVDERRPTGVHCRRTEKYVVARKVNRYLALVATALYLREYALIAKLSYSSLSKGTVKSTTSFLEGVM